MEGQISSIFDNRKAHDEDIFTADHFDEDDASFGLVLDSSGLPGGFHTNDPNTRFQRATITARRGAVDIRCKAQVVVHGKLSPEDDNFATLLVYDFYVHCTKRFRRLKSVEVHFDFTGSGSRRDGPEVYKMAPERSWSLLETSQQERVERKSGIALPNWGFTGANIHGSHEWTKAIERTTTDYTMLRGGTTCDKFGKETGAKWVMHENGSDVPRKGVPSFLRTAIVLQRKTNDHFELAVKMDIEADWKTEMTRLFAWKSRERDDPIFFNPALPPIIKLQGLKDKFDVANLAAVNVDDLFDVTFYTTFDASIKGQTG